MKIDFHLIIKKRKKKKINEKSNTTTIRTEKSEIYMHIETNDEKYIAIICCSSVPIFIFIHTEFQRTLSDPIINQIKRKNERESGKC